MSDAQDMHDAVVRGLDPLVHVLELAHMNWCAQHADSPWPVVSLGQYQAAAVRQWLAEYDGPQEETGTTGASETR